MCLIYAAKVVYLSEEKKNQAFFFNDYISKLTRNHESLWLEFIQALESTFMQF